MNYLYSVIFITIGVITYSFLFNSKPIDFFSLHYFTSYLVPSVLVGVLLNTLIACYRIHRKNTK